MNWWRRCLSWFGSRTEPEHLRRGRIGEAAARRRLEAVGLKFLLANYRSPRGEIDLVFRDGEFLQYVSFAINILSGLQ